MTDILHTAEQRQFKTPGGNTTTPLAAPATGAKELLVVRQQQEPGGHNPLHRKSAEALVVLLDGSITVGTPEASSALGPGDSCLVPAGELHQIRNAGETPATWLVATTADVTFSAEDGRPVEPVWAS